MVVPGNIQLSVPAWREHWVNFDVAPSLRRTDMGDGDFAIETRVDLNAGSTQQNYEFDLMIGFDQYDQLWLSADANGNLGIIRSGTEEVSYPGNHGLPLSLRIEKAGDQYTFLYKADAGDDWTTLGVRTITTPAAYVGVQVRTFYTTTSNAIFDVDSFRLEYSSPTPDVVVDEFDGAELDPAWEWYVNPATWSLTADPGHFQFTVPYWLHHVVAAPPVDSAPSLRRTDMGDGDFAIESRVDRGAGSALNNYALSVMVGYDQYDQLWCRVNADGSVRLTRLGYTTPASIPSSNLPLTLRLEKHGDQYTCMYKADPTDNWTTIATVIVDRPVAYVGVEVRTDRPAASPQDAIIDVDYFRLEKPLAGTPTATSTPSPAATDTSIPADTLTPTDTLVPTESMTPSETWTPFDTLTPTFILTPSLTLVPSATATSIPFGPITIDYAYDSLYRLTATDYSTGEFYHYTYDTVGNRLTAQTHLETNAYVYDNANRLTSVDSVSYTWDNNGNLLNDGTSTYAYDSANRLISIVNPQSSIVNRYNGLGDRYQQSVNSQTTTYALDLNAGLTQVLDDGENTYLYGLGRILQTNNSTDEYFLGDALGSVRQLVDGGEIVLAKSYTPYGEVMSTAGSGVSAFA